MSVEEARERILDHVTYNDDKANTAIDRLILEVQEDVILKAEAADAELGQALRRILGRGAILVEGQPPGR